MADRLTQFSWPVLDGYRWVRVTSPGSSKAGWFLMGTPAEDAGADRGFLYAPLQGSTGLFKELASIDSAASVDHLKAAILNFAKQRGMLTSGTWISVDGRAELGESIDFWRHEIFSLAHAVTLWGLAKARDSSGLGEFIRWEGQNSVVYERGGKLASGEIIASPSTSPEILSTLVRGDVIMPAWIQLQRIINDQLSKNVSPALLWNSNRTKLALYHLPKDLRSAVWLQFARALEGDRKFNQCEECRNWFEIESPDGGRSDKKYCGSACRARAWRKSKGGAK